MPIWANIPIIGWLFLKGRCTHCNERISIQYPLVELLTAGLTLLSFYIYGATIIGVVFTVFIWFLIVIAIIDFKTQLIFNKVLITLLLFGLVAQFFFPFTTWSEAGIGFLAGGFSMLAIALLGKAMFKKESLGMGDVKFAAVAGFFVGWSSVLIALYIGFIFAFLTMIITGRIKKQEMGKYIPLGPFLAAGLVTFLFWGKELTQLYWNLVS